MQDFSTTQDSTNPVSRCPSDCNEAMNMAMDEVNKINRIPDALERNAAINTAYQTLGREWEDNWWVRLAGYVSVQGGCAIKTVRNGILASAAFPPVAPFVGPGLVKSMEALRDANTTIFSSVYPPNKFMHNCGYERLKECNEAGAFEPPINQKLMAGLKQLDQGDLRGAADLIAFHEQVDVVQPVYGRHKDAFAFMEAVENRIPGDQTSIPVSYECGDEPVVPLGDLEIRNPLDRVDYYKDLMNRMMEIEGLP